MSCVNQAPGLLRVLGAGMAQEIQRGGAIARQSQQKQNLELTLFKIPQIWGGEWGTVGGFPDSR